MIKHSVRYFNNKEVRAIWENNEAKWWYSAIDLVSILTNSNNPRKYWNTFKNRHLELSSKCRQLKIYANDGKKYLSDVIDEDGFRVLLTLIPSKYKNEVSDWIKGLLDPIDEQSKKKAYELFKTNLINEEEVGKTIALQKIHGYLFEGLYPFAGKIRNKTISKNGFMFANGDFLPFILKDIDNMPDNTYDEIIKKYIEVNIAHPFLEGNGRATRIWLDMLLTNRLNKCIDWSKVNKKDYLEAMELSPYNFKPIYTLLKRALTGDISNRELFLKGIDYSYYYEEVE